MKECTFVFLKNWFHQYVQGFYSTDEQLQFHVRLKEEHTLRVLENATKIGAWLECAPEQLELIKIAALFHDIGRFKQYQTYRTFNDALSINHAQLGVEIIQQSNILKSSGLNGTQQEIVEKAVLYHNRRQLPPEEIEKYCVPAKIIRDADKIDIFAMLVTKDDKNKIPQATEFENALLYSEKVIEDILQGRLVEYPDIKTKNDLLLFRLSWLYDLYFPYSFSVVLEQGYLEKLIAMLPDTQEVHSVYQCLWEYTNHHVMGNNITVREV